MYHLFNAMLPYCKRYAKILNYFEKKIVIVALICADSCYNCGRFIIFAN